MSIHERDYYREDYAKKNGMIYDSGNATYRIAPAKKKGRAVKPQTRLSILVKLLFWLVVFAVLHAFFRRLSLP